MKTLPETRRELAENLARSKLAKEQAEADYRTALDAFTFYTRDVLAAREDNGTFRVRGKRGRLLCEWLAGATTIVNAIDRYAEHKA